MRYFASDESVKPSSPAAITRRRRAGVVWRRAIAVCGVSLGAAMSLLAADNSPAAKKFDAGRIVSLLELVLDEQTGNPDSARQCLAVLATKIQNREISAEELTALKPRLEPTLLKVLNAADHPLRVDATLVAAACKNPAGVAAARELFKSSQQPAEIRLRAADALIAAGDGEILASIAEELTNTGAAGEFRGALLASLGKLDSPAVADAVLRGYPKLGPELQARAIELLTQRAAWSHALLAAMGRGEIPRAALNANQVRRLLSSPDKTLVKAVSEQWGSLRTERDPRREAVIADMRKMLQQSPGDAVAGQKVFQKVCGQCHKIHGEGADVGPDITVNGRASFEQLLSNVFDPSLVIGAAYQARIVQTTDGRALTGLLAEESPQRIVLKVQGGKQEIIAREDVAELEVSKLSMMPEDVEKQFTPRELADLFAFLVLDKPPSDPAAKRLPDAPRPAVKAER